MSTTLSIKHRESIGSNACKKIRNAGSIPGVIYGEKKDAVAIQFSADDFGNYLKTKEPIINLSLDDNKQEAIVQKLQYDSMGDNVVHVDFLRISNDKPISIPVDLETYGTPVGVGMGGTVNVRLNKVSVTCLPADIPKNIRASIAHLNISEQLKVADIPTHEKYTINNHPDTTIVIVRPPRKAREKKEKDKKDKK